MHTGEDKINTGEVKAITLERNRVVLEKSKAILECAGPVLEMGETVWRGAVARGGREQVVGYEGVFCRVRRGALVIFL